MSSEAILGLSSILLQMDDLPRALYKCKQQHCAVQHAAVLVLQADIRCGGSPGTLRGWLLVGISLLTQGGASQRRASSPILWRTERWCRSCYSRPGLRASAALQH